MPDRPCVRHSFSHAFFATRAVEVARQLEAMGRRRDLSGAAGPMAELDAQATGVLAQLASMVGPS